MEEGAKRRLAGATVIVLLLVIFLPMLLEEEEPDPFSGDEQVMPAEPDFERRLEDPTPAAPPRVSAPLELPPPSWLAEPEPEPTPERVPPEPVNEPASPPIARVAPEPERREPPEERQAEATGGWVLQVASLKERARALALERELRAAGFPAFIQDARVDGQLFHRVRVGPRRERAGIEALAETLREKTGYQGQIRRHGSPE